MRETLLRAGGRIASREWPPFKAVHTSTVPKHPVQNLWHAIEPKFLAEGVASVSHDRRRGGGSTPVSSAPLPLPSALGSPVAPIVRDSPAAPHAELVLLLSVDCSIPSWGAPRPERGLGCVAVAHRIEGMAAL